LREALGAARITPCSPLSRPSIASPVRKIFLEILSGFYRPQRANHVGQRGAEFAVLFLLIVDGPGGMEDGGVVSAPEVAADFLEAERGEFANIADDILSANVSERSGVLNSSASD
jgi:hypothetical protein